MNFITDNPKRLYKKFLFASVFSALVISVFSFVDAIAVGQSEGPRGTAALAVLLPFWGILNFIPTLCGIGGAVLMSGEKGAGRERSGNSYFTAALGVMTIIVAVTWAAFALYHDEIFILFGSDEALLPKVMEYAKWMIWFLPLFMIPGFLGTFIRNDGAPSLVMAAVSAGGILNIIGDYVLVFPLKMGMEGAAIATVAGMILQNLIMFTRFFSKDCRLKAVVPENSIKHFADVLKVGFGASIIEMGIVLVGVMMNNQIMKYSGTAELAVFGAVMTVYQLFFSVFRGVGQAIQPLVSANFGAAKFDRTRLFGSMSLKTMLSISSVFMIVTELFPVTITKIFINATPEIISAAPKIFRLFFLVFIPSGLGVLAIYYLQSTMRSRASMAIALLKGLIAGSSFIWFLPMIMGINGVWLALPCAETITAAAAAFIIFKGKKRAQSPAN